MLYAKILLLAVIQGLAELLPVSSSAHVIVAEKLLGLDPAAADMTFLLVMLHTGTMVAVIAYFWPRWKALFSSETVDRTQAAGDPTRGRSFLRGVVIATVATAIVGFAAKHLIEKFVLGGHGEKAEIENLFGNLRLIAASLAAAGLVIIWSSFSKKPTRALGTVEAAVVGAVQGLCLPFRGFSRSGATISTGLRLGLTRGLAENFSFALAVILTPPVIARELWRLLRARNDAGVTVDYSQILLPGLVGMVVSFGAGYLAIRWLSRWLETGKWQYFGYYCLVFAGLVFALSSRI